MILVPNREAIAEAQRAEAAAEAAEATETAEAGGEIESTKGK
jgi:hypothetical protein